MPTQEAVDGEHGHTRPFLQVLRQPASWDEVVPLRFGFSDVQVRPQSTQLGLLFIYHHLLLHLQSSIVETVTDTVAMTTKAEASNHKMTKISSNETIALKTEEMIWQCRAGLDNLTVVKIVTENHFYELFYRK